MRRRPNILALICWLAACPSALHAQDAVVPAAPPARVVPPPKTPDQLIDKSVRDIQRGDVSAAVKDDVKALRRGPLLIHGNYCGIGNRPGSVPVDALDTACMHHDACTTTGAMPSCACDNRLRLEATAIAQNPDTSPALQTMAAAVAASMAVLICK